MKTPTINSRILKLEVLKDTATRTSVNAVESRTTSLESDIATAQGDISTLQTDVSAVEGDISTLQGDVATLTQGIASAVSTHNTAPDSHADLRTLVAGKQDSLTISTVGEAMLAIATPSGQKIPRVNADGSVVLINVPSGDGVGGSSWYASDDGPPSVGISLSWVSNGDANGVVYLAGRTLGNGSFTNPSISGGPLAMLRSSNGDGNAMQLTDRAPNVSYSANIQNSWICCDLGAYALGLTSYSLRHQSSLNVDHIRTWRLQGSNMVTWSIAGVAAAEWVDVDVRSNDTTISAVDAWGHWSLPQQAPSYRYIRLLQDGPNSTNRYYLTVAEWEFYGTLTGTAATRPLPAGSAGWARNSELIDDATAWMPYYATSALTDGTPIFGTAYDVASAVSTHNTAPDAHADLRTALAGKQDAGSYLTTTGTAANSAKLGAQLPAYYLARSNHTGTQPASSVSDFAATTRATVATGMVTTSPAVALATDTLLAIIGKLQAQINSDRRYDYAAQIGGGENLLVPIGTTGGGTGISVFNLYSEIENTATLTSGEFYSDVNGTTSLGRSVPLAAGTYTSLFIKLTSGTDTLVVTHGWAVTSFGNASACLEEGTNGPRALGFDLKYMPRGVGIAYFYCIYSVVSGQTAPWINATFLYFLGNSLSISGQTYPWSLATVVFFNGSGITISGQAYAWVNARRVILSGNLIAVSVNLSASCMYIGSAGLDIFIDGSGILVSYPTSRAWPAVLGRIYLRPASGTMPSADVDRLCNDLATYTTSATGDKVLDLRGSCGVATSASATARTYLAGLGISVSVNT